MPHDTLAPTQTDLLLSLHFTPGPDGSYVKDHYTATGCPGTRSLIRIANEHTGVYKEAHTAGEIVAFIILDEIGQM